MNGNTYQSISFSLQLTIKSFQDAPSLPPSCLPSSCLLYLWRPVGIFKNCEEYVWVFTGEDVVPPLLCAPWCCVVGVFQSSVAINHTGNVAKSKSKSVLSIKLIESIMLITKYKALTKSAASHIWHYSAACRIMICCLKNGNVMGVSSMAKGRFTVG